MVFGWSNVELAHHENDENCDGATVTNLVDKWVENPNLTSSNDQVVIFELLHLVSISFKLG